MQEMTIEWPQVVQIANMVIALIVAFGGIVPIVSFLKDKLNTPPRYSQMLAVGVCVVYTILSMILQGVIAPESLTMANMGTTFVAVLTASQAEYQRVQRAGEKANV